MDRLLVGETAKDTHTTSVGSHTVMARHSAVQRLTTASLDLISCVDSDINLTCSLCLSERVCAVCPMSCTRDCWCALVLPAGPLRDRVFGIVDGVARLRGQTDGRL